MPTAAGVRLHLSVLLVVAAVTSGQYPPDGRPVPGAVFCPQDVARVPCGQDHNRGACIRRSQLQNANLVSPSCGGGDWFPYSKICSCINNWGGPACGECRPGYKGADCQTRATAVRKSFKQLSDEEKRKFVEVIQRMAEDSSQYVLPDGTPISTYHNYAWLHGAALEVNAVNPDGLNMAHESAGFPTWHRGFLLYFEWEMHDHGWPKDLGLPYWDWTEPDALNIFDNRYFGGDGAPDLGWRVVNGPFAGWPVMWANGSYYGTLTRHFGADPMATQLPSTTELAETLAFDDYDSWPWNTSVNHSFRNYLEGVLQVGNSIKRSTMHNKVHRYVGGTMADVRVSPNDPIFWLHHCFTDLIFERWLLAHPGATFQPIGGAPPGHNRYDCAFGLIPMVTNDEMFRASDQLGYVYAEFLPGDSDDSLGAGAIAGIVVGCVVACLLCVGVMILVIVYAKRNGYTLLH